MLVFTTYECLSGNSWFIFTGYNRQAPIWDYYDLNRDEEYARCKICSKTLKMKKGYSCSSLYSHMKRHPDYYKIIMDEKEEWLKQVKSKLSKFFADIIQH